MVSTDEPHLTSRKSQGQTPQNQRVSHLTINLASQIYLVFFGHISERYFWEEAFHPKVCLSIHIFISSPHMFITRKIKVLTFSTEDPAQILLYSMAGKPQLMVLQREEKKAPSMYVSIFLGVQSPSSVDEHPQTLRLL